MEKNRRVCAYVDLGAMIDNVRAMKANIAEETKIIAVIKTNGYGHGALPMAKRLEEEECIFGYAVATAEEALSLREEGIAKPILILGYVFPEYYEELIEKDVRMTLFRYDQMGELAVLGKRLGKDAKVHIKVDSAMSRIGIFPDEDGLDFVGAAVSTQGLETEGLFTHFARADEADKTAVNAQFERFSGFMEQVKERFPGAIKYFHASNSAGISSPCPS